jgi:peptidyl-prolyl cis-trans isomerase D
MLQIIREKTSGLIAILIVGALIVSFALWGVGSYFDQGGDVIAISVNDTDIELREYQRVYQSVSRQFQEFLKQSSGSLDDELVKKQTLESLIERELVTQVGDDLGLRVSANQVRSVINSLEAFQGLSGFDNSVYERAIAQLGYTPAMFERQIQQDMRSEQLQSSISESVIVTENEVRMIAGLQNQTRDISYSIISSDKIKEELSFSDEEIKAFYETNSRDYLDPEKVKIAFLDLSLQKIAGDLTVSEDDIRAFYESNKADYDVEDQRKVRHITIETSEEATEEQINIARTRAEELIAKLRGGMSFDELSEKHSDGPGPKVEISELGFLTKGIMDAAVDEVMFSLQEGEISEPIVAEKSVDVVMVESIKGGAKNTFEDTREQVEEAYRISIAENQFFEAIDQLANLAYEHPDTLEIAAEDLELTLNESEFFNRNSQSDPLLSDSKIIAASFSEDVLNGNNSEVIEIASNRVMVLRVLERKAEQKIPFEEVRERIVTRMKYEKARNQVQTKGESILEKLKSGSSVDQVATDFSIEWKDATAIKRDNTGVNRSVLRTAFKLGRPESGQAVFGGSSLGSGDYAVVMVKGVFDPDASSYKEEELQQIKAQLQRLKAASSWTQLVKDVRSQSDINVFKDRL